MPAKHCGVHAALIVGSPSFVKASVLWCLPNQRERLKHAFVGAKPAGIPTAGPASAKITLFLLRKVVRILHTKRASEPVK